MNHHTESRDFLRHLTRSRGPAPLPEGLATRDRAADLIQGNRVPNEGKVIEKSGAELAAYQRWKFVADLTGVEIP